MTEAAIKRVNFFDGQFLKQGEFLGLENYHRHMRRRLLHMLFDQSGVVQLGANDLKVLIADAAQKLITVKAGLAIGKRDDLVEAKEIVLREDQLIDLDGVIPPLQNGDTAVVTIHYDEVPTDHSVEGGIPGDTRVAELAVITVHKSPLTLANAPNGEPYIRLGEVDFQNMGPPSAAGRVVSRIRAELLAAAAPGPGPGPVPTITSIVPAVGTVGAAASTFHVNGTNLTGASAITFPAAAAITAGALTAVTATGFDVQLTIGPGAAPGPYAFSVTTPLGPANSAAGAFTVNAVVVTVVTIIPTIATIQAAAPPGTLTVRGTNIRNPALAVGAAATGTVVRFVRTTNPTVVLATATNPLVLANVGANQAVQVSFPLTADFAPADRDPSVSVQVLFGGGSGIAPAALNLSYL